ncbi:enoyl-CoA hydratase/isomerase family protein [Aquimarina sp. Aq78]|uniref:enoyl-CoA hydratase/isomerase family protein n=1 Tax=Aquimarina sp. Aq78 TaxID=1191889 RepID=UPI000D0FBD8D|nr:enoyl-CoA hydratase/isomerase family protein [Aquimarina sp. Aq78]
MDTTEFKTFKVTVKNAQAWVTFDYEPVNIQGVPMLDDLNNLAEQLENDRSIKVVVFQSAHPEIFVAHADTNMLKDMSTVAVPREEVKTLYIQDVLNRISKLPQATIAKVEGFARGGGHEFMLACDMRFAARGKAKFMQMEVGMGILPCGGGSSRMARQVGLGKALEIILMAKDFDADEAERFGTINRALDASKIGSYVEDLADRISKFPAESIEACKRTVYASIDLSIDDAIKEEAYWLYQSMSKTPAQKRFQYADDNGAQFDMNNQRAWNDLVIGIQDVK